MKREEWTKRFEQVCKDVLFTEGSKSEDESMLTSHGDPYVTAAMMLDAVSLPEGTLCEVEWGHGAGPCPDPTIQQAVDLCDKTKKEKVVVLLLVNNSTGDVIDKRAIIPARVLALLDRKPDDCREEESFVPKKRRRKEKNEDVS